MFPERIDRQAARAFGPKRPRDAGVIDEAGFEVGELVGSSGGGRGGRRGGGGRREGVGSEAIEFVVMDGVAADGAELEDEAVEERGQLAFGFDEAPVGEDGAPAGGVAVGVAGEVGGFVGEGEGEHVAEDALEGDGGAAVGGVGGGGGNGVLGSEEVVGGVFEVAAEGEVLLVVGSQGVDLFLPGAGGGGGRAGG